MNSRSHSSEASVPVGRRFALRFISGKYQGGEFPLNEGKAVIVGRASDLDMVLVEDMVSRRHARIELRGGLVHIEDLGSTNGTFVNGERVQSALLREGDRLLIGTSIMKLVSVERHTGPGSHLGHAASDKVKKRPSGSAVAARMTGNLQDIPLPDLMQLFGTSRKTGVLVIEGADVGRIVLKDGLIQDATIEGSPGIPALKAAYRMLSWTEGTFVLEPPANQEPANPLNLSAQEYLMEGFRQLDESNALKARLPNLDQRYGLKSPLEAPLHELEQTELEVLQFVIDSPHLQAALDRSSLSDLETMKVMVDLLRRGYIAPVGG